ncbi:hypothetical protein [Agathobaculum desmolans]|nr:hypothetical protein [Agathobaculum desmolans]
MVSIATAFSIECAIANRTRWVKFSVILDKIHAPVAGFDENGSLLPFSV